VPLHACAVLAYESILLGYFRYVIFEVLNWFHSMLTGILTNTIVFNSSPYQSDLVAMFT